MAQVINFQQDSETIQVDNGTLTNNVVQTYSYTWSGSTAFQGTPVIYTDIDMAPVNTATSTTNYDSNSIEFTSSYWNTAASSGTVSTSNVIDTVNSFTGYVYVDGVQVASGSGGTYSLPAGSHTLTVEIVSSSGSSSSKSYSSANFVAGTEDWSVTVTSVIINGQTIYQGHTSANWNVSSASANYYTQPIYLNPSNQLALGNNCIIDGSGNMSIIGNFDANHQIATTIQSSLTATAWTGAMEMSAPGAATWTNGTGRNAFVFVVWNSSTVSLATTGTVAINMTQNTSTGKIYFMIMENGAVITNPSFVGYGVFWVAL